MIPKSYQIKANKSSHWLKRKNPTPDHIKLIKKYLKVKKPKTLDIGCAEGENTNIFKQNSFNVTGIDYDKRLLNLARKNYPKVKFELGNVEKLKYKSSQFDLTYCINTLFYTDISRSISEILRVTKNNGLVFITFDISITDLDKNKIIHKDSLKKLKEIIGDKADIVYKQKRQRTDLTPFKHIHCYYDLLMEIK